MKEKIRRIKAYRLKDLLARVRKDNLHDEVPTGKPQGKEAW